MPEPDGTDSCPRWDEVVDVICVGPGPGSLAYAIGCAAADREVLLVKKPAKPDAVLIDLLEEMTEDLGDPEPDCALAVGTAVPEPPAAESGFRATMKSPLAAPLEPFVGQQLRGWSAQCLASPYGVMFTEVPDVLAPMRTSGGQSITAAILGDYRDSLCASLLRHADGYGLVAADRLAGLVVADGRIAGAALDTASGPWLVGVTEGIAVSVGPMWPEPPESAGADHSADHGADLEVAVVGRRFGRFARVELFRR